MAGILLLGAAPGAASSLSRSVINPSIDSGELYLNIAKGLGISSATAGYNLTFDADQYPQGDTTPYAAGSGNMSWPATYYGRFVWKYTGIATMAINGPPLLIYNQSPSGAVNSTSGATGAVTLNATMSTSANNPRVLGAFGALLNSQTTNGGWVQFTTPSNGLSNAVNSTLTALALSTLVGNGTTATATTAAPHGLPTGLSVSVVIAGSATPSFNATVTITVTGASTFTFLSAVNGTAATPGTFALRGAIVQFENVTGSLSPSTNYIALRIDSANFVVQSLAVAPGITTTGGAGVQSAVLMAFGQVTCSLPPFASYAWSNLIICKEADEAAITAGQQITQAAIDSLTGTGAAYLRFMDLLSVQAIYTNFTYRTRITSRNLGSGVVPDYRVSAITNGGSDNYTCVNPNATTGQTGPLADGEVVQGYPSATNTGQSPTLAITGRSTGAKPILQQRTPLQILIFTGAASVGDTFTMTFTASYLNGGVPYALVYTCISGDNSPSTMMPRVSNFLAADTTLTNAGFQFGYSGTTNEIDMFYNRNLAFVFNGSTAGTTFAVTPGGGNAGTGVGAFGTVKANTVGTGYVTFIYSKLLDGWIQQGYIGGAPLEIVQEMCSRTGMGAWLCTPLAYTDASISALGTWAANNIPQPVVIECANEIWNSAAVPVNNAIAYGVCLGFAPTSANNGTQFMSFQGLRSKQTSDLFSATWVGTGRARSALRCIIANFVAEGNGGGTGTMVSRAWNGSQLVLSNATYAALGGPGWNTAGSDYSIGSPTFSRPIDSHDGCSYATYFQGSLAKQGTTSWFGTQSFYNSLFQASADYATGVPASMASALAAVDADIFNGTRNGVVEDLSTVDSFVGSGKPVPGFEAKCAVYDGARPPGKSNLGVLLYEGALEVTLTGGSASQTGTSDPSQWTDLNAQFTSNGWTLSPTYGASNAVVAQNLITLYIAYFNSQVYRARTLAFFNSMAGIHASRPFFGPAWYGYSQIPTSVWTLYTGGLSGTRYTAYDAIADFNT